jgi:hypothetical protein
MGLKDKLISDVNSTLLDLVGGDFTDKKYQTKYKPDGGYSNDSYTGTYLNKPGKDAKYMFPIDDSKDI